VALPSVLYRRPVPDSGGEQCEDHPYAPDLKLDQIVASIVGNRREHDFMTRTFFCHLHDASAVRYRQEIFRDLEEPVLLGQIQRFSEFMHEVRAHLGQLEKMSYRYQREGWILDAAATYCDAVRLLEKSLADGQLTSAGLMALREYLAAYVSSAGFIRLASDTDQRKDGLARVRYCARIHSGRVDVSRYQNEADYSATVLKVFERFKQGAAQDYRVRYRAQPGMNHITAQILEMVTRLFPGEFAALDEYCQRHTAFVDEGIRRIDQEFQFYLAYLDHIRPLKSAGLRFCYPEVSGTSKEVSADGAFDLALARKLVWKQEPVITNDFQLKGRERIIVVTGPNQGGKTTFARTFGQLHHLASIGCPVPGSSARLFLFDRLFTHFAREEDLIRMSGKLEDDLVRIAGILRSVTPSSIVILNEIFASTTLQDARFLGTKLLTKIERLGALCVCVTFVDELASLGEPVVSMMSTVLPANPAERTFKVVRKPADGLAYALAIAQKYGLTYERLRERVVS
jgi:DNA mismatch repair ATPase MutS